MSTSSLDILRASANASQRRHPDDEEHRIQCACVAWFRLQYPQFRHNLFAVPNGGRRDAATGAKMKEEGVLAGVSDLILLKSNNDYHALLIEMKTSKGHQSDNQKAWEKAIVPDGYRYVVVRSFEDFMREIRCYLAEF